MAAFLRQIRWGEIDGDFTSGKGEVIVLKGGDDPLSTFPDGAISESDQMLPKSPSGDIDFDRNDTGMNAFDGTAISFDEHDESVVLTNNRGIAHSGNTEYWICSGQRINLW